MSKLTLEHIAGNTYYIPSPTNVGLYIDKGAAILIDSGNDKDAGRQILRLLESHGLTLKLIINTHSNADHIGGNAYLQKQTDCRIAATRMESAFITDPIFESALLYGSEPIKDIKNKFFLAKPSVVTDIISSKGAILDTSLESIPLPGHYFDMIGIKTPDNIVFLGDSLFSKIVAEKYQLYYLLDIQKHLYTLESLKVLEADYYIPSHCELHTDINELININIDTVNEIVETVYNICDTGKIFEDILQEVCIHYNVKLNITQYVLLGSTVKAYLTYLYHNERLSIDFQDGRMTWKNFR